MTDKKTTPKAKKETNTLVVPVYGTSGKEVRTITLPEEFFAADWNESLVHQVVVSMESNARAPIAHAKGRGEVSGGGKKPWKQKGTGRARHGSTRSPIWVGGGVSHGPTKDRNFSKKINKKMRLAALASVLSAKLADGEIIFVDMPEFKEPKTAAAKKALQSFGGVSGYDTLATRRNNAALIMLPERDENTEKSFQNIGSVALIEARNLNPVALLTYRYVVIANPEATLETLKARMK